VVKFHKDNSYIFMVFVRLSILFVVVFFSLFYVDFFCFFVLFFFLVCLLLLFYFCACLFLFFALFCFIYFLLLKIIADRNDTIPLPVVFEEKKGVIQSPSTCGSCAKLCPVRFQSTQRYVNCIYYRAIQGTIPTSSSG